MEDTYHRAFREILHYITEFALTRNYGGEQLFPGSRGFVNGNIDRKCKIGDLIALQSAPTSEWYLSWLVTMEPNDRWPRYLLKSIETGKLCWWVL